MNAPTPTTTCPECRQHVGQGHECPAHGRAWVVLWNDHRPGAVRVVDDEMRNRGDDV